MFGKAKQLFELQGKAKKLQKELKNIVFVGEEFGGKVKVTATGEQKIISIEIDDSLVNLEEKDSLIKFTTQATNAALKKAQQAAGRKTKEIMGGLGIPGL